MNHSRLIFLAALTVASCLVCAPAHGKAIMSAEKTALWEKNPDASGRKLSSTAESPDFAMEAEGYGYESAMGRAYWLSRDPIGERGGINLYGMVSNDPVNRWDYLGWADYKLGAPTEPPMSFDEDFPYDPNAKPTWGDYGSAAWWSTKSAGAELLGHLPDAVRAYNHYRGGSGSDLEINYPKAYREDTGVKDGVNNEIAAAQADAEKLWDGKSSSFQITGQAAGVPNGNTENWQKTIGAHMIWGGATVTPCGPNGEWTMEITIHEKDRYNFNRGASDIATGAPDNANGRFSELGWAKSFITYGEVKKKVTWKKGQIPATTKIQDPGRR